MGVVCGVGCDLRRDSLRESDRWMWFVNYRSFQFGWQSHLHQLICKPLYTLHSPKCLSGVVGGCGLCFLVRPLPPFSVTIVLREIGF